MRDSTSSTNGLTYHMQQSVSFFRFLTKIGFILLAQFRVFAPYYYLGKWGGARPFK